MCVCTNPAPARPITLRRPFPASMISRVTFTPERTTSPSYWEITVRSSGPFMTFSMSLWPAWEKVVPQDTSTGSAARIFRVRSPKAWVEGKRRDKKAIVEVCHNTVLWDEGMTLLITRGSKAPFFRFQPNPSLSSWQPPPLPLPKLPRYYPLLSSHGMCGSTLRASRTSFPPFFPRTAPIPLSSS